MSTSISYRAYSPIRLLLLLCLAAFALLHTGKANAQSCSAATTSVAFGNVDVVASSQNYSNSYSSTAANISVTCSILSIIADNRFSVCVNIQGAVGSTPRTMTGPAGSSLNYNLYSGSAPPSSPVWGAYPSTNPGPVVTNFSFLSVLILGGSSTSNVPIYGYLQSSQNTTAVPGGYTQTPTATLSWNYANGSTPVPCTSGPSGTHGTSSFTLTSTANVTDDCGVTATTINFGVGVGVLTSPITANGTITATCTNGGTNYTIALNKGTTTGGSLSDRQMAGSGSAVVHYQLYDNSSYTTIWGDGTSGTGTQGGTATGTSLAFTVYGRVQAQTTPAPNTYSDTVMVTVSY
jgi:spore coat protein U-like protein